MLPLEPADTCRIMFMKVENEIAIYTLLQCRLLLFQENGVLIVSEDQV